MKGIANRQKKIVAPKRAPVPRPPKPMPKKRRKN
jgi:hypothetical protein